MGLKERILVAVGQNPGLTDREITDLLLGASTPQQSVNQAARALANAGLTARVARPDGKIGNFPQAARPPERSSQTKSDATASDGISEDMVKRAVAAWLEASHWTVEVRWGRERGIDVEALRKSERWIIEAKGGGSRDAMHVNYFIAMLGETLQRMSDPDARYSIALAEMQQFRRLWERLPALAKDRTGISAIFVSVEGRATHLE